MPCMFGKYMSHTAPDDPSVDELEAEDIPRALRERGTEL
jgi:hypothetical protein